MEEVNDWIPVKGYEGLYEVSGILGKVRSLNYNKTGKVKILTGGFDGNGYVHLRLCKNGKKRTFQEHRIVAEHFRPNPFNKPCVNHLNEKKSDNRACNLSWTTYKENNNYGTRNERLVKPAPMVRNQNQSSNTLSTVSSSVSGRRQRNVGGAGLNKPLSPAVAEENIKHIKAMSGDIKG